MKVCEEIHERRLNKMDKRFNLKTWDYNKLNATIYDHLKEEELHLSIFEIIELLNKVSQSEYDLKKSEYDLRMLRDDIIQKLDEINGDD